MTDLSDTELAAELKAMVVHEREDLIGILRRLMEFDKRRLHAPLGFPSLYEYCVRELGYGEGAAYRRIRAARAARRRPEVLRELEGGGVTLETVALLNPYAYDDDFPELFARAVGRSKREVERLVAERSPWGGPTGDFVRQLGMRSPQAAAEPPSSTDVAAAAPAATGGLLSALRPSLVRIAFTATQELWGKIERARGLLRHKHPQGRLENVVGEAVDALLDRKDPDRRLARREDAPPPEPPRADDRSRRIPQWVRDAVWRRDDGRCAFVSAEGRRCGADEWLEFDHLMPWALGGPSNNPRNIRLLCREHNQMEARRAFGGET